MSKVESAKALTSASANGAVSEARIPVSAKSSVPATRRAANGPSLRAPAGIASRAHTTETSPAGTELIEFRNELDRRGVPDSSVVVADRCLHFVVPYLLRRPTLAAFEEWQVGFENRVPLARRAATVLEGGDEGRQLARSLGVRYVVVDPQCSPDVEAGLGGTTVVRNDALVIVELPARG